jgi:hypothetical protein
MRQIGYVNPAAQRIVAQIGIGKIDRGDDDIDSVLETFHQDLPSVNRRLTECRDRNKRAFLMLPYRSWVSAFAARDTRDFELQCHGVLN